MNISELLPKLDNIAKGLGYSKNVHPSTIIQPDGDFYNDDKIVIQTDSPNFYRVDIMVDSNKREEVLFYTHGLVVKYRIGNWLNYIESLQHEAIESRRMRKQEADERALRLKAELAASEAAKFAPIDDTDIFGKK